MPRTTDLLDSLQVLRALAALSVVLYHVDFLGRGAFGVDVFFVLSGFIICYVTAHGHRFFFLKRVIRIVPLYWAATVSVFLLAIVMPNLLQTRSNSLEGLLKSLLFFPYEKQPGRAYPILFLGWTLNYEMFFYLVFSLALFIRASLAPFIAAALLLMLVVAGQWVAPISVAGRFYTDPILLEFILGILIYLVWHRYRDSWASASPVVAAVAALAAAVLLLGFSGVDQTNRFLLWGVPGAFVVAAALWLQGKVVFPAFLVLLGDASYSLYLLHPYALKAVEKVIGPTDVLTGRSAVTAALGISLSIVPALVSYRFFERPLTRFFRRRLEKPSRFPGASPAPQKLIRPLRKNTQAS